MPQKDDEAAELEHAEEISFMIFPTGNQSAEVVEPGEKAFDFPVTAVAAQFATVLRAFLAPIVLERDWPPLRTPTLPVRRICSRD